jgi:hypothetical protein
MAQQPRQPSADAAPFVRDIVSDPKNVPDVMLLYGYLGASSEEGHDRLYLSPDLTNYVEVPKDAVLHRMEAPKEQDPHGGVTLWVKKDAALIYKMAPAAEALAHYFAGAVQAGAGQAAGAAAVQPTPPLTLFGPACGVTPACTVNTCGIACTVVGPCPTMRTPCPQATCGIDCSVVGPCLSHHVTCMHFCTHVTPCHTRGQPQCPFPTEATCAPVCTGIACMPGGQPGQAAMAAPCLGGTAVGTVPIVCTPACSIIGCPTQQGWVCQSQHTPCCPVSPFCPPASPGCSLGCGLGQPGPVDQAALGMARGPMAAPPSFGGCTFLVFGGFGGCASAGCQSIAVCPTLVCTFPPHGCRG